MGVPDVIVIGAGVSGLTTALHLLEAKLSVRVVAEWQLDATTSAAAGASWGPYLVSDARVLAWSRTSLAALRDIAHLGKHTGVRIISGMETHVENVDPPPWSVDVKDFQLCRPDEVPDGYATGWRYTIPIVDMRRYLRYLNDGLTAHGVRVEHMRVESLKQLAGMAGAIVNCTGLGARDLVPDATVYPTRGQLVVVENPGVEEFFQDNTHGEDLTYILPHGDHVILGGCAIEHSSRTDADPNTTAAIVARCALIEPGLRDARIIGDRVGLRPSRSSIRIEREEIDGLRVIHNYGHGGSGLTLSWGCAAEVLRLVG